MEQHAFTLSAHECKEESTQKVRGDHEDTNNAIFRIFSVTKFYTRTIYFQKIEFITDSTKAKHKIITTIYKDN